MVPGEIYAHEQFYISPESGRYERKYILILAGDHIYKMNYASLIEDHVEKGSPCTVACIEVPLEEATAFGVMTVDANRRITRFEEKPVQPQAMPGRPDTAMASMGVYVFVANVFGLL